MIYFYGKLKGFVWTLIMSKKASEEEENLISIMIPNYNYEHGLYI